jgi:protein-S-isoprenylcysteine O-methyltransferase Ste14
MVLLWLALLRTRIRYEERVLTAAYPEYADYRARVGMFGPRFWAR